MERAALCQTSIENASPARIFSSETGFGTPGAPDIRPARSAGVNGKLASSPPYTISGQPVATLSDACPDLGRNQLAAELVAGLLAMLSTFEKCGFQAWQAEWNQRHAFANQPIHVLQGKQGCEATAGDVDASGNLWVTEENGQSRRLAGGEISIRRRL